MEVASGFETFGNNNKNNKASSYKTSVEQLPIITTKANTFRIPEEHNVILPCDVEDLGKNEFPAFPS